MVWCSHCSSHVNGMREGGRLACELCGRVLEDFYFSEDVTFIKNAAGQSQASGNIVSSVHSGKSSSRERRIRIARDEFMNLKDALGIGDERDDVVNMAVRFFTMAAEQNFTKGRRTELVQSSCLYLTCREKKIPLLLIDFSSYLRVSVYELGSVYLQLCELLYIVENKNYENLVDPSLYIPRFTNSLLKGAQDKAKNVVKTATAIIASMKRDWMQTGRKPSGVCGAAIYIAALSHGVMCARTDIGKIVHMCEATITKRLIEFANTEAASLNVDELTERERELHNNTFNSTPNSDNGVNCIHKDCKPFRCGLCESCYNVFDKVSGGLDGGSDPPAFQRAEKERIEKAAREENEGGIGSLNHDEPLNVSKREKQCPEKGQGEKDGHSEASDESGSFSDVDDSEVDDNLLNEEETRLKTIAWNLQNREYLEEQAAKEAALKDLNANNANCPEYARKLVEASKAAVTKSRKEKQQKRAEEAKNAPPPATAMEAVGRMLEKKRLSGLINYDLLEELFDTSPVEESPKRSRIKTDMEEKKKEVKSNEHEDDSDEEMSEIFK
ncbi:hypothetical protein EUTSA_v10011362mg [Eutrema salsugineum]|uniref:Cyclin-like domain-containing protein n=1 Tax=Eutrema salsugineum TaxID=72664 RepID=V4MFY1_EUTSA|nr:transcription factor IIIB 60 kDa subunit [Eutrema salsugineum]ESQ30216.1 hypothetical protein EUTSA_v10011362mg [Eutrema salsugineum]